MAHYKLPIIKWPLYYYIVDANPGDTAGEGVNGSGGLWYLIAPNGQPIIPPSSSPNSALTPLINAASIEFPNSNSTSNSTIENPLNTTENQNSYESIVQPNSTGNAALNGTIISSNETFLKTGNTVWGKDIVDTNGISLYAFQADVNGSSSCYDLCELAWPPVIIAEGQELPLNLESGLNSSLLSNFTREGGSTQLMWDNMPLYYFVRDNLPGEIFGQGVKSAGNVWWLVKPEGGYLFTNSTSAQDQSSNSSGN